MPIANLSNVKLNYLQINYQINDEKIEDIIMIHGLATNLAFWYAIANNLTLINSQNQAINSRITLFDLTGHGRSSMPETGYTCTDIAHQLLQLIEYLKIDKFHLIAHSFGGSIAVDFFNLFPEKVKSLILADVRLKILQPEQIPRNWQNWELINQELTKVGINLPPDEPEAGIKLLTAIAQIQINQPDLSNINTEILGKLIPIQQNIQTAKKWLKLIETTTAMTDFSQKEEINKDQLKELREKTYLIYGERSPNLMTKIELEKFFNFNHNYLVENAGHFFPLSQPQIFREKITEFIANKL